MVHEYNQHLQGSILAKSNWTHGLALSKSAQFSVARDGGGVRNSRLKRDGLAELG